MKHRITKQECADKIKGVCSNCGGKLEPIETVDNSNNPTFWSGCMKCSKFDNGIDPKVYEIAKEMVEERHYRHYHHHREEESDSKELRQYKKECQISGTCGVVVDILHIAKRIKEKE